MRSQRTLYDGPARSVRGGRCPRRARAAGALVAAVNIGTRKVNGFSSEVLVLGVPDEDGRVVLLAPERDVPPGGKMF